jgi:hypothetical protein
MWRRLFLFLLFAAISAHAQYSANLQNHSLNTQRVDVAFVRPSPNNQALPIESFRESFNQGSVLAALCRVSGTRGREFRDHFVYRGLQLVWIPNAI